MQRAPGYTLPATGPDGLTQMAVIYETYSVAVNGTFVGTVSMSPSVQPSSQTSGPTTTYQLPAAVQVP